MNHWRTIFKLEQYGVTRAEYLAIHDVISKQHDHKGGQSTNAGCGRGHCEHGDPACAAWTKLADVLGIVLPDRKLS